MRSFNPPNLDAATEIVYDTETDGLDWRNNRVCGYVITWGPSPSETVYYPVRHSDANYDHTQVKAWMKSLAKRRNIRWTGHALKFDLHFSANEGIFFEGDLNCTKVNASLINEEQYGYELDECAEAYGAPGKKGEEVYTHLANLFGGPPDRKQMKNFHRLRGDDVAGVEYAKGDGTTTWHVWQKQKELIELEKLAIIHGVECRVIRTLFRMERKGVRIDEHRYNEVRKLVAEKVSRARALLPPDFNPRSPTMMTKLMTDHGHTDWPMTPPSKKFRNGQPSFKEEWLMGHEIGRNIIRLRKFTNLQNSFLDGQILNHLHDGRIHTTFNQTKMDDYGTVTGRLSSSDPNLQQCPKRDKELAPIFRSIFIPDDGFVWKANDYKQQEFVVFSHYSGSEALAKGYNQDPPVDMHQYAAEEMGVERDPTAKRLNLGKLYGMGVDKLAKSLGISVQEARALSKKWDARIPEAKQFLADAKKTCEVKGYVRTILGRRRRLDNAHANKAGNAIIQMCSADITKLKMAEIDEHFIANGESCQMLLQIHDELDWQVPKDGSADLVHDEALRIMEDFGPTSLLPLDVRLRVDASSGNNWSEATFS